MKKAGTIILIAGLLLTVFAGFNFVTKEKVMEVGKLEITRKKDHIMDWSPSIGIVVMIIGGGLYLYGSKKG